MFDQLESLASGALNNPILTVLACIGTLAAYLLAMLLYRATGQSPLANPVLVGIILVIGGLLAVGVDYETYFVGARPLHFLLSTATVALAIPLHRQLHRLKRALSPILIAILAGSLVASTSAMLIAKWMGASVDTVISMSAKSVTTPVAIGITEGLNGSPALSAVIVILTGILGAVFGAQLLVRAQVTDPRSMGLAIGTAAHGIGTARALLINEQTGAFAGLALGINALMTAVTAPLLVALIN